MGVCCFDKTGTLTEDTFTVDTVELYDAKTGTLVEDEGDEDEESQS